MRSSSDAATSPLGMENGLPMPSLECAVLQKSAEVSESDVTALSSSRTCTTLGSSSQGVRDPMKRRVAHLEELLATACEELARSTETLSKTMTLRTDGGEDRSTTQQSGESVLETIRRSLASRAGKNRTDPADGPIPSLRGASDYQLCDALQKFVQSGKREDHVFAKVEAEPQEILKKDENPTVGGHSLIVLDVTSMFSCRPIAPKLNRNSSSQTTERSTQTTPWFDAVPTFDTAVSPTGAGAAGVVDTALANTTRDAERSPSALLPTTPAEVMNAIVNIPDVTTAMEKASPSPVGTVKGASATGAPATETESCSSAATPNPERERAATAAVALCPLQEAVGLEKHHHPLTPAPDASEETETPAGLERSSLRTPATADHHGTPTNRVESHIAEGDRSPSSVIPGAAVPAQGGGGVGGLETGGFANTVVNTDEVRCVPESVLRDVEQLQDQIHCAQRLAADQRKRVELLEKENRLLRYKNEKHAAERAAVARTASGVWDGGSSLTVRCAAAQHSTPPKPCLESVEAFEEVMASEIDASFDKEEELRRLRILLRFSELKKDSDQLETTKEKLNRTLSEQSRMQREITKNDVKLNELKGCLESVSETLLSLLPYAASDMDAKGIAERVREQCRGVDVQLKEPTADRRIMCRTTLPASDPNADTNSPPRTTTRKLPRSSTLYKIPSGVRTKKEKRRESGRDSAVSHLSTSSWEPPPCFPHRRESSDAILAEERRTPSDVEPSPSQHSRLQKAMRDARTLAAVLSQKHGGEEVRGYSECDPQRAQGGISRKNSTAARQSRPGSSTPWSPNRSLCESVYSGQRSKRSSTRNSLRGTSKGRSSSSAVWA